MSDNKVGKEKNQKAFTGLLSFQSEEEEIDYQAQMLSFKILSEIEKVLEERKISKKKLAEKIGVSPDHMTQLFQGDKTIDLITCAKIEKELILKFEITLMNTSNMRPVK